MKDKPVGLETMNAPRSLQSRLSLAMAATALAIFWLSHASALAQSELDLVNLEYVYADFETGSGKTLSFAGSTVVFESDSAPAFVALFGRVGSAQDDLALAELVDIDFRLQQRWYRAGALAGIDISSDDRERKVYGILGYEYNDVDLIFPFGFSQADRYKGEILGAGALLQYSSRNTLDFRGFRVRYADPLGRYTTWELQNYHKRGWWGLSTGISYNKSSVDSVAVHIGLSLYFRDYFPN